LDDASIDRFRVHKITHPNTYQTDDEYGYSVHDGTLLSLWSNGFLQSISIFKPLTGSAPSAEPGEWPPIVSLLKKHPEMSGNPFKYGIAAVSPVMYVN
jgi:hypothetical protein